jgi:hypothetical protein
VGRLNPWTLSACPAKYLADLDPVQLLLVLVDQLDPAHEQPRAVAGTGVPPGRERFRRRGDRGVHVGGRATWHVQQGLTGGRIDHLDGRTARRRDPLAADQLGVLGDQPAEARVGWGDGHA